MELELNCPNLGNIFMPNKYHGYIKLKNFVLVILTPQMTPLHQLLQHVVHLDAQLPLQLPLEEQFQHRHQHQEAIFFTISMLLLLFHFLHKQKISQK